MTGWQSVVCRQWWWIGQELEAGPWQQALVNPGWRVSVELLQTVADQLQVGRTIRFCVRDEADNLLLASGSQVSSEAQIKMLLARGVYVEFDEPEEDDEPDPADDARMTVFQRWKASVRRLERLLASIGRPGFDTRCDAFTDALVGLVNRDPDIAIYHAVRQDPTQLIRYGLHHALHSAMLAQLAGTRAGWPAPRVRSLVQAALTMNLATVDVQGLQASLGRLNDAQRERLRNHPQVAHDKLAAAGIDDDDWLQGVLQHHERDGSGGYPQQLKQVGEMGQALRMIDTFLAKISARSARKAMTVQDAARELFQGAKGHPLAAAIIKEFGIVPPGHFVQLASGELAIVVRRGATAHTPVAAAVTDAKGRPVLSTTLRDTAQAGFAVRGTQPDERALVRVPAERVYGLVA